ncbi:MAG: hypothetical protein K2L99_08995, partial [Muribaculaceae bacterium]|nr:hypothetical protein [Muribaculaceae bacterium]
AEAREALLVSVLSQDYPAPGEVVVVNEGDSTEIRDLVTRLQITYPNLYLTFTPDGAHSLSRKKLALTLGIKAARYDTVVHTAVGARIRSDKWLRSMMRHFARGGEVEVVIGYAAAMPDDDTAGGARCRAFDATMDAARWFGAAVAGQPFRASEYNVAYRREAFFRNKGFSRSLNLHFGDDDIFISEIAHEGNTAVELSDNSIVGVISPDYSRASRQASLRRVFTEGHIGRRPRVWRTVAAACVPASFAALVAAVCLDAGNAFVIALAVGILALLAGTITVTWRSAMWALNLRVLGSSIFPLALTYIMRRAVLRLRARFGHHKRYTWD